MLGPDQERPVLDPDYGAGQRHVCGRCGAYPAAPVDLRAHHGLVLWMEREKAAGPFCRSCGISEFRDLTAETLARGWWGFFSFFVTPYVLVANCLAYLRLRGLAEPVPGSPRAPLRIGKPVHRRWAIAGLVVPLVVVGVVAYAATRPEDADMRKAQIGDCVVNAGTVAKPRMRFVDCGSAEPEVYKVLLRIDRTTSDVGCPAESSASFALDADGSDHDYVVCLAPVKPGIVGV